MPVRILSVPFIIAALVMLYLTWEVDEAYSVYIVPPVLILALLYIFGPQINWWWYRRRPPELEGPLRQLLSGHGFYQGLGAEEKRRFRERIALYMMAREYMPMAMESVPEDVKMAVAAAAVQLTFGQEDYLLDPFEKVVIYPKPFPSPQFPGHFHASEIFEEDGVLLFSAGQLMRSFAEPARFYSTGLHEFARAYRHLHPGAPWPELPGDIWERLEAVSGMSRESITRWINLPEAAVPALAVCVVHFFTFPERFREQLPDCYRALASVFGIQS